MNEGGAGQKGPGQEGGRGGRRGGRAGTGAGQGWGMGRQSQGAVGAEVEGAADRAGKVQGDRGHKTECFS